MTGARRKKTRTRKLANDGEEATLEDASLVTTKVSGSGDEYMQIRKAALETIAIIIAAAVIGIGGVLWAGMQSLQQIQSDRYTRDDGKNEREERVAADRIQDDRMNELAIQMTKLAEREGSASSSRARVERRLEQIEEKLDAFIGRYRHGIEPKGITGE